MPVAALLSDARVEGMAGNLAIRSMNMSQRIESLIVVVDSIVRLTN